MTADRTIFLFNLIHKSLTDSMDLLEIAKTKFVSI